MLLIVVSRLYTPFARYVKHMKGGALPTPLLLNVIIIHALLVQDVYCLSDRKVQVFER